MATIRKKLTRKKLQGRTTLVFVIEKDILPEETLFPEKVAAAKAMLRNIKVLDPRIGPINIDPD
jgi:predicted transglutaminase-like protease